MERDESLLSLAFNYKDYFQNPRLKIVKTFRKLDKKCSIYEKKLEINRAVFYRGLFF